jgi:hypothetical protein
MRRQQCRSHYHKTRLRTDSRRDMPAHHPESAGVCAARNAPSTPRYVLRDPHMACEKAPTHVGLVPPNLITMHAKKPPSTPYRCCDLLSLSQTPARYQSRSIHHFLSAHSWCDVTEGKGCAVSNAAHTTIKTRLRTESRLELLARRKPKCV